MYYNIYNLDQRLSTFLCGGTHYFFSTNLVGRVRSKNAYFIQKFGIILINFLINFQTLPSKSENACKYLNISHVHSPSPEKSTT